MEVNLLSTYSLQHFYNLPATSGLHFSLLQIAPCMKPPLTSRISCLLTPPKISPHETSPSKRYGSKRKMKSSAPFIAHERRYKLDALCISSPLQPNSTPSKPLSIEEYLETLKIPLPTHTHTLITCCQCSTPNS